MQKMSSPLPWYQGNKQTNKTNPCPKPQATKTITRKSIYTYTASYSFNDSINDNIALTGRVADSIVHSVYFWFFFFLGQNERKCCFDRNCLLSLQSKSVIKAAVKQQNVGDFQTGQSILHLFTQTTSSKCQNQEKTVSSLTALVREWRLSPFHKNEICRF